MTIWLINHYALTPEMSGGTRHYDIAKELVRRGHRVRIVASSLHYATLKEMKVYGDSSHIDEVIEGIDFTWVQTRSYKGNGLGRVINMVDFAWKAWRLLKMYPRPDVIVGSSVHLFAVYAAYRLAKRVEVPFVMEVRDIWPQTLIDMGISKWHPFIILLGWLERLLYRKAKRVITLLPRAYEHMCRFGVSKEQVEWISNGVDMEPFQVQQPSMLLNPHQFNIVYAGTMGTANHLQVLIETARRLRDYDAIHFTCVGSGPDKEALKRMAEDLSNVSFLDPLPKVQVPGLLAEADVLYVGLKALPLYRFGMSMNKVFDYMAAAKPVVFASSVVENPVKKAGSGMVIEPDDVKGIADAMLSLYNMPVKEREAMGQKGYNYVAQYHAMPVIVDRFEYLMKKVVDEG